MKVKKSWVNRYFVVAIVLLICLQLVLSFDFVNIPKTNNFVAAQVNGLSGEGTSDNPYKISTVSNLITLANHVNSGGVTTNTYFEMTNSIDVSGYTFQIGTLKSTSSTPYYFDGIFEGNNCVIYNHTITNDSTNYTGDLGLFGYFRGQLKNLRLSGGTVTLTVSNKSAGAFVGSMSSDASIIGCYNLSCNVLANEVNESSNIGGIVGYASGTNSISQSFNMANVTNKSKVYAYAGGILGYDNDKKTTISECFNDANITAGYTWTLLFFLKYYTTDSYAAGICSYGGRIKNCYNLGDIEAIAETSTKNYYMGFDGNYKTGDKYYKYDYNSGTFKENSNMTDSSLKSEDIVYGTNNFFRVRILEAYDLHSRSVTVKNGYAYGIAYSPYSISYCYNYGDFTGGTTGNSSTIFYCKLYDGLFETSSNFKIEISFINYDKSGPISNVYGSYCYYYNSRPCNAYSTFNFSGANTSSGTYYYDNYDNVNKKISVKLGGTTQYVRYNGSNSYYLWMYDEDYKDSTRENFIQISSDAYSNKNYLTYEKTPSLYKGTRYSSLTNLKNAVVNNFSSSIWAMNEKILGGYPYLKNLFWEDMVN